MLFSGRMSTAATSLSRNQAVSTPNGYVALIAGALMTRAVIETNTAWLLFFGTAVAGAGFGPAFSGAFRSVVALAPADDRAGVITAIYIVSYLATAVPAVAGGIATTVYGLHETALGYSLAVAVLAAAAVTASLVRLRRAAAGMSQRRWTGLDSSHSRPPIRASTR